ncbi:MAG TPA: SRPBCC domain-containing protein [Thermomicrobiales bacterium]|jgi:uncharacterized protein YndB with AHSA1/START domain
MTDDERRLGTIDYRDKQVIVRMERRLGAPPAEVWQLLTDPEELPLWLAEVEMEPRVGGAFNLTFENTNSSSRGQITRFEPVSTFEFMWQTGEKFESLVCFALHPTADNAGTDLVLTHTTLHTREGANEYAAGWHHHLDLLAARAAGLAADWNWLQFNDLLEGYTGSMNDERRSTNGE